MKPIRVLVIDDSPIVRDALTSGLNQDDQIEVVGTAVDPYMAREKIAQLRPDVLTLDIEMPRMNGVQFLRYLMPQFPLPVVVVSALTKKGELATIAALEAGAIDFVTKPGMSSSQGVEEMLEELRTKVKIAATADVSYWKRKRPKIEAKKQEPSLDFGFLNKYVIAIGASTGGVNAVSSILTNLPQKNPGILVVQHMPSGFTKSYAERLNTMCPFEVKEAETGDHVLPGRVLIAPGEKHLTFQNNAGIFTVQCKNGDKVKGHCPSVEVLFHSVAVNAGKNAIGIILTGMGSDGAEGMLEMRKNGARTLAQDEKSSVVFGMPLEAYKNGGAERLVSLEQIPAVLTELVKEFREPVKH
jgi:two-component system chemotaxis response regulator CheB